MYKKRHLIENMFAKLKDWRRVATRYDRCAHTFMSAIHIAASFIFCLRE
ncbi:transposase [Acetobacter thailandicus]|nr:transposase [Acetobacter thailandicus]